MTTLTMQRQWNEESQIVRQMRTEIADARAELAQARKEAALLNRVLIDANELHAEVRAELADACAARDALARKCDELKGKRAFNAQTTRESITLRTKLMKTRVGLNEREIQLAQVREELAQARAELAQAREELGYARRVARLWFRRAQEAEAELADGHAVLTESSIPEYRFGGNRLIGSRALELKQRAERAEALAQIVTPELAELLARLAAFASATATRQPAMNDAQKAYGLAAKIREALDDNQA